MISVLGLAALLGLVVSGQLLQVPVSWLTGHPDRAEAASGLAQLGLDAGRLRLSLAPERSVIALLAFLAPLAGFCLIARLKWSRGAQMLKWSVPILGALSAVFGLVQIFLDSSGEYYLYEFTSKNLPAGFFSNVNHQASFLLMCLPFIAVLASELYRDWEGGDEETALALLLLVLFLLILTGIFGAGSVAGYLLLVPVLFLSIPLMFHRARRRDGSSWYGGLIVAAVLALSGGFVFTSPVLEGLGVTSFEDGPLSRRGIADVSLEMLDAHWLFGSGLGSFEAVYHLYEDPALVSSTYIAHAHNDYLQWAIEMGLAGMVLLGGLLLWWAVRFVQIWTRRSMGAAGLRRAASIACLVPVLHSAVDYPLRTPAIAVLAGMCFAVMVVPIARKTGMGEDTSSPATDERPHVSVTL